MILLYYRRKGVPGKADSSIIPASHTPEERSQIKCCQQETHPIFLKVTETDTSTI